jgi:hypothetical protein
MKASMLHTKELMRLHPLERARRVREAFNAALNKLHDRDLNLLAMGAHEQAICHRVGVYLDAMTDLNVDCEYNRDMMDAKRLRSGNRFRPDIIVHRRFSNEENLLVVEAKATARGGRTDLDRLKELVNQRERYRYFTGVFIMFINHRDRVQRTGEILIRLRWFPAMPGFLKRRR